MEQKEKLKVSDIHKSYGDNTVLRGVSLTANAGDVISIIGSSGSGKSTFLRCINIWKNPITARLPSMVNCLTSSQAKQAIWLPTTASSCNIFAAACVWCFNTSTCGNT